MELKQRTRSLNRQRQLSRRNKAEKGENFYPIRAREKRTPRQKSASSDKKPYGMKGRKTRVYVIQPSKMSESGAVRVIVPQGENIFRFCRQNCIHIGNRRTLTIMVSNFVSFQ